MKNRASKLPARHYIGRPLISKENERLVRGAGRYLADLSLPKTLCMVFLRSLCSHARFKIESRPSVDPEKGVRLVLTAEDLGGLIRPMHNNPGRPGERDPPRPVLADNEVRFSGECIGAVVADDCYRARDALDDFQVNYELLPAAVDVVAALADNAPLVHPDFGDNRYVQAERQFGDVDRAFATAKVVVARTVRFGRVTGIPMEPRGCLAAYDQREDRLTLWSSTQIPHILRSAVAEFLDRRESHVRVITPDVGGGFGVKSHVFPEELLTCAAAIRLGRPVRWLEDRSENVQSSIHARDALVKAELAADASGRILGLRFEILSNSGAYPNIPFGPFLDAGTAAGGILGPYNVPAYGFRAVAVATHTAPNGACRGVGIPLGTAAVELLLDEIALKLQLDRAEIRRRNLIRAEEQPFTNVCGIVHEATSHADAFEKALKAAGYAEGFKNKSEGSDRLTGVGICCYAENTAGGSSRFHGRGLYRIPGYDSARVTIAPDGRVTVTVSLPSQGQGHRTTFAQVAADQLGVSPETIEVVEVDTDVTPYGTGTFNSRSMVLGGGAILKAARQLREKLLMVAGSMLEVSPADLNIEDGVIQATRAPTMRIPLEHVARIAYGLAPGELPGDLEPGLECAVSFDPSDSTTGNGTHIAVVEVDRKTGVVHVVKYVVAHDCGLIVNPSVVEGQVVGGVAMAIGEVLLEEVVYNPDGGLETGSLMNYLIPSAMDVPLLSMTHFETFSDGLPTPFKGVGEAGVMGGVGAIASAVNDALRQCDARLTRLPMTPERVWKALNNPSRSQE